MANSTTDLSNEELLQLENALEAAEDDPRFLNGGDLVNVIHIILKRFAPAGYEPRQTDFPEVLTSKKPKLAATAEELAGDTSVGSTDDAADGDSGEDAGGSTDNAADDDDSGKSKGTKAVKGLPGKPKSAAERALRAAKG